MKAAGLLIALLLVTSASGVTLDITPPYNETVTTSHNVTGNYTLLGNGTYTSPENTSFQNDTLNITWRVTVPNGTNDTLTNETWTLNNESITFTLNITTPQNTTNTTINQTTPNITITKYEPFNGRTFITGENPPITVRIQYDGTINYAASKIDLKYNGSTRSWIQPTTTTGEFGWALDQTPNGDYTGQWILTDNQGRNKSVNYTFSIQQRSVAQPEILNPSRGVYNDEEEELLVRTPTGYTIEYLTTDDNPAIRAGWKLLTKNGQEHRTTIDFRDEPLGHVYLRVTDEYGNQEIKPTGLVSGEYFTINIEGGTPRVRPDTEVELDIEINRKRGSGRDLRCRLGELRSEGSNPARINTDGRLEISDEEITVSRQYDKIIKIPDEQKVTATLYITIPVDAPTDKDYEAALECAQGGI